MRIVHSKMNTQVTHLGLSRDIFNQKQNRFKHKKGQGVIEFVIVSSSIIFFIFLFINLCYVFLVTQYIDYAVYMSARALTAAHGTKDIQYAFAEKTLRRMLGMDRGGAFGALVNFKTTPSEAVRVTAKYPNPRRTDNTVAGVRIEYEVPVFLIPPIGIIKAEDLKGISRMNLVSEAYLDREPTQNECYEYFEAFVEKNFSYLSEDEQRAVVREASDNGC